MKPLNDENFAELIADEDEQKKLLRIRRLPRYERSISKKEFSGETDDGWVVLDDTLKTRIKLAKDKSKSEIFEDEVWCVLAKLGFKYLSADRNCTIKYAEEHGASQQIDILAVDNETAIIIECKCADSDVPVKGNFKSTIEAIGGKKAGLHRKIRELFGNKNLKIAYIFATKNYQVTNADKERLESFGIRHFSNADLDYYSDLVNHLGTAARFQLQADLFPGQDIPEIENRVYAIRGKMGDHTYYSFSIEPAKLLKIGYILHRTKSIKLLPSYQRLIKKSRLKQVHTFVENGGYFPNSIIISIDSNGKKLKFDQASPSIENASTRMGVLHLPKRYRSAYIVDGQHRLYAYNGSQYAEKNALPVVAFVDLERTEQLEIFMQINENQKAVSRNLKHTLDADLKWDSDNLRDRAEGIKKQLAQDLGEDTSSPLYERILVGEDQRTEYKIITLEAILKGLNQTNFVGKFTKDEIKEPGIFNTSSSQKTLDLIKAVLFGYFELLAANLPDEWRRKQSDYGLLTINDGVTALIMVLGDIIQHMGAQEEIKPLGDSPETIVSKVENYLPGIYKFFEHLSDDDRAELRSKYGSGAPARLRRIFQKAINEERDDFSPEGLDEYWRDQSKIFNVETYKRVADIETLLKENFKEVLVNTYKAMWLKKGLPENFIRT